LLLKKREIAYLIGKIQEKGLTLVPVKMYTKRSFVKLEFALGRGKKKYDKRESIKKRELDRQIRTLTKRQISR
jgi:SsrA-binding protein